MSGYNSDHIDRREFLRTSGKLGLAAGIGSAVGSPLLAEAQPVGLQTTPFEEQGLAIPDDGWRLWLDTKAPWKNDEIFLPADVVLEKLPVNAPTGGWDALDSSNGVGVQLPATVEQYFWGKLGERSYTPDEYRYAADDPVPQNGAYEGVSWWWREIDIPRSFAGKTILLHIRGARFRAEVYLNGKLTGYSIMEELPFTADLTAAAKPGQKNVLAIRITNPGGRYDWVDSATLTWGNATFRRSHGFGGVDRGLTLSAHGPVRIADAWVLNTPEGKTVNAVAQVLNSSQRAVKGSIEFAVIDANNKVCARQSVPATLKAGETQKLEAKLTCPQAKLWDLDSPTLYKMRARWTSAGSKEADTRTREFGFRWFGPEGLGKNAIFRMNGRRMKLYTSISWGYWGLNGLWPVPELAEKEVKTAKALNLNCLNFHRNVAKEDVLLAQDRLGLLRAMEPGGGRLAFEKPNDPPAQQFNHKYLQIYCVEMVKAFRSHPSVVEYIVQNEMKGDLSHPTTSALLAAMHAEDPSRSVVLNDGFSDAPQAWFPPYAVKMLSSADGGNGGWWVSHQMRHFSNGGDLWSDDYYKNPKEFHYRADNTTEIAEFGEMTSSSAPENHVRMLEQIKRMGGHSYDRQDHEAIVSGYEQFLDRWGFRKAFPTVSYLLDAIGRRSYESWSQYMENVRISEDVDFAAISGWESTAIENHGGIVDNLRNPKGDPALIAASLRPVRPVAKQRQLVCALGAPALFDLYLLNDLPQAVTGKLVFSVTDPSGRKKVLATLAAPAWEKDKFSYLLQESFATEPLTVEGPHRFRFELQGDPAGAHERVIWVVNPKPGLPRPLKVGLAGISPATNRVLQGLPGVELEAFQASANYDVIVASGVVGENGKTGVIGDVTGEEDLSKKKTTDVPEGRLPDGVLEAVKNGAKLFFVSQSDPQTVGVAKQLAAAGAFEYKGMVGVHRAPWMGTWYFVREHPIYAGLPVNCAMATDYQVKGNHSNGVIVDGPGVEVIAGYSRDHDRHCGAGTFTAKLGKGAIVFQRVPQMHAVFQQRVFANILSFLSKAE